MSKFTDMRALAAAALAAMVVSAPALADGKFAGIGRAATPAEIKAWDIDVRPDFKGLPAGSGSVTTGQDVWEDKCASCHGIFGESGEVFTPIVGGISKEDLKTGRVANLARHDFPQRTTLMKMSTLSTMWDYINRAMPWNAPKSLTTDQVYAVTAYILHLGDILPADFVLSDKNIAEVQAILPNRNGVTTKHGLWDVKGKPDVVNVACMKNCATDAKEASALPDAAKNTHGNLIDQNRPIGPVRGVNTDPNAPKQQESKAAGPEALVKKHSCNACHATNTKMVGPSWADVAAKYKGDASAGAKLVAKAKAGGEGVWGQIPMPPQTAPDADLQAIVQWVLGGAR